MAPSSPVHHSSLGSAFQAASAGVGKVSLGSSKLKHASASLIGRIVSSTKRRVVLHRDHGHTHLPHHHSPVEMEMEFVVVLVLIHLVALCFWMYLLYRSKGKEQRGRGRGGYSNASSGSVSSWFGGDSHETQQHHHDARHHKSSGTANQNSSSHARTWRTPGEILSSWSKTAQKQRLGKV